MKKTIKIFLIIIFCFVLAGCNKEPFSLEEKYYNSSSYIELNTDELNRLIKNKESFAIFIYQPLCTTSYEFDKVLTEFLEIYQMSFYKIAFSDMKETILSKYIKYYPSLVIYQNGKMVDYLDASSNQDVEYFKSVAGFKTWFSQYVLIKNVDYTNNSVKE